MKIVCRVAADNFLNERQCAVILSLSKDLRKKYKTHKTKTKWN